MEKFIITTGKTLDLAIAAALEELKLDRTSVSVEVLEQPKSGFLGFGAQPAKVKVSYEADEPVAVPAAALSSASRSKPKAQKTAEQSKAEIKFEAKPAPAPAPKAETPAAPKPQRTERKPEKKPESPKPQEPKVVKEYPVAEAGSTEERIEVFVKGLLEHMGSDAVPHAVKSGDDVYNVDLVGNSLGMLIGHRGETLDAIQHLTNYVVNREAGKRARINIDAECYRQKREESLARLANKVAGKVVRYRRNITLEPMNAYERHVIHAALQDTPDVTTYSTGTEPNRRIVVAYSRYRSTEK
ncbi:RNA-binding cell elongation regulator Jag/EloR [Candidatus Avoscillospira sp. LCP25S3_F1]|uniref:RNA-binding cell elongation regulator Jag/EloR n=1 Tax=Candidatus Avoscillospira sp. LCP25S3_F1 TaxID=3438825 RepID=UPI003F903B12